MNVRISMARGAFRPATIALLLVSCAGAHGIVEVPPDIRAWQRLGPEMTLYLDGNTVLGCAKDGCVDLDGVAAVRSARAIPIVPDSPVGVWGDGGRIELRADGTAFSSCCGGNDPTYLDQLLDQRRRGTWRIERGVTRIDWTTGSSVALVDTSDALVVTGGRAIGAHYVLTAKAPVQRDAMAGSWAAGEEVLVFDGEGHWTARLGERFDTRRRYAISGAAVVLTDRESTVATIDAFEAKWHRIDGIAAAVVGKWKNEEDLIGCPGPSTEHIVHWLDLHADGSCVFRVIDGRGAHPVDHCVWFVHEGVLVVDVPNGEYREPSPFVVRGDPARPTHLYFDGRWWHR